MTLILAVNTGLMLAGIGLCGYSAYRLSKAVTAMEKLTEPEQENEQ